MESAKPDVLVLSLCEKGDAFIMAETGKVFKKEKEMKKGEPNIAPVSLIYFGVSCFGPSKEERICNHDGSVVVLQVSITLISFSQDASIIGPSSGCRLLHPFYSLLAKLVNDFQMKTWWFSFPSSRHCVSHQRLSQ